jgi:hypothetical protein
MGPRQGGCPGLNKPVVCQANGDYSLPPAFFARILVHFVGFGDGVGEGEGRRREEERETLFNQLLYLVTPFQKMRAVNIELVRQMSGRYALSATVQD